jgi:hypothetical protein
MEIFKKHISYLIVILLLIIIIFDTISFSDALKSINSAYEITKVLIPSAPKPDNTRIILDFIFRLLFNIIIALSVAVLLNKKHVEKIYESTSSNSYVNPYIAEQTKPVHITDNNVDLSNHIIHDSKEYYLKEFFQDVEISDVGTDAENVRIGQILHLDGVSVINYKKIVIGTINNEKIQKLIIEYTKNDAVIMVRAQDTPLSKIIIGFYVK